MIAVQAFEGQSTDVELRRRSVMLTDEELLILRSAAHNQGCRSGKVLHQIITGALAKLAQDPAIQQTQRHLRSERIGLHLLPSEPE